MEDLGRTRRRALRGGLLVLAVTPAWIGFWGSVAPRSFYRDFPGGGRHWVAGLPPYNEHLIRDFAAMNLGFLVLLVFAAAVLERRLVQAALIAFAVAGTPHLAYHLTTTGSYSTGDNVATLIGLAFNVVFPLALLALTRRPRTVAPPWKTPSDGS